MIKQAVWLIAICLFAAQAHASTKIDAALEEKKKSELIFTNPAQSDDEEDKTLQIAASAVLGAKLFGWGTYGIRSFEQHRAKVLGKIRPPRKTGAKAKFNYGQLVSLRKATAWAVAKGAALLGATALIVSATPKDWSDMSHYGAGVSLAFVGNIVWEVVALQRRKMHLPTAVFGLAASVAGGFAATALALW